MPYWASGSEECEGFIFCYFPTKKYPMASKARTATITATVIKVTFPLPEDGWGVGAVDVGAGPENTPAFGMAGASGWMATGTLTDWGNPPLRPMASTSDAIVRTATSDDEVGMAGAASAARD